MKKRIMILAFVAVVALASMMPSGASSTSINKTSPDSYAISSEFIDLLYNGLGTFSIGDFEVGEKNLRVFDEITMDSFEPKKEPYVENGMVVLEGEFATAIVHDNPSATIVLDTRVRNSASFRFAPAIGSINTGKSILLGNESFTAELVLQGVGTIVQNPQLQYSFDLQEGSRIIFRNDFMNGMPIGERIASGDVAGELFIGKDQYSMTEDLVDYMPVSMRALQQTDSGLEFEVKGDVQGGKVLIFDISRAVLDLDKNDIALKVDSADARMVDLEDVYGPWSEPRFAVAESGGYLQVYLYVPSFSVHSVSIGKLLPQPVKYGEFIIGLGFAATISTFSAFYLFRKRRD